MEENGVWRTVSGRRVFIKDGQSLSDAMRESGKFSMKETETATEKFRATNKLIKEISKSIRRLDPDDEAYDENVKEKMKEINELKNEKANIYKELEEDKLEAKELEGEPLKEIKEKIANFEDELIEEIKEKIADFENEKDIANELIEQYQGKIEEELRIELKNIEILDEDYLGIEMGVVDERESKTMKTLRELRDEEIISDYVYESLNDKTNEIASSIMEEKGYEPYYPEARSEAYFSTLPKAKEAYDKMLVEFDKKNYDYNISRSWNPGELPSIYVMNKYGDTFRISNHYNNKNEQFSVGSMDANKIYSNKDYINFESTILNDLNNFMTAE